MLHAVAYNPAVESIEWFKKFIPEFAITSQASNMRVTNQYCVKIFIN